MLTNVTITNTAYDDRDIATGPMGDRMTEPSTPNSPSDAEHLRVMVSDFEAQLDSVAGLVARVRHEINNPLAGVLGQAQLLLREDLNDKARKRVETIETLAMRLRDIVGQLREVQRPREMQKRVVE